jgi:hypothetical protein
MQTRTLFALLILALIFAACGAQESSTLISKAGAAPYYTNLADAQAAARADQYIVVDFYTDW